jgi:ADP-ribose pyrophosphatase YjhB (NUDIX family)
VNNLKQQVTRIAAYGLVLQDSKILLCRLSQQLPLDAGYWTLPGGGINFGEDPLEAMIREVYEETGLVVRASSLAGINSFYEESEARDFHGIRIIYHTEIIGGSLRNELDGSTDLCAWWTLKETKQLPLVDLSVIGLGLAFPEGRDYSLC